jgi:NAD(P)-dependent dehydrogenase (short-subunit alcohol dehydrogenase family)
MSTTPPNALVIGASRGLGLALAEEYRKRGWSVVATVRGTARTGLHDLAARSEGRLEIETVDITEPDQISALRRRLDGRTFDLLFVNAGILTNTAQTIGQVPTEDFTRLMVTNALSPMRVIEAFESLVKPAGTIGVMSSGLGSIARNSHGSWDAYSASKAALNMLMNCFAARHSDGKRAMVIMAPGWVRTDMGGPRADLAIADSIPGVVDAIASRTGKPGLRYLDYRGQTVPW